MNRLIQPFLDFVWQSRTLRSRVVACTLLSLAAAAAEITVAVTLIPILVSLGVDAGESLGAFVSDLAPGTWLVLFAAAAGIRSVINWLSSIVNERGTHELTVSLQSRLYRAMASAHWDTVRRISPPSLTSALQTFSYDAGYGFSSLVHAISAIFLVAGYLISAALVFPVVIPPVLLALVLIWRLNARNSHLILERAGDYHNAQEGLHQRYEDWVAISRIGTLGVDASGLADEFESVAREASAHAVGVSHSSAITRINYDVGVVAAILVGVPIAWWLETPPALLAFGLMLLVRILPRAGAIHSGYQGVVGAVAPISSITRIAQKLEADPASRSNNPDPLNWQSLSLSNIGVEDTMRDASRRWILKDVGLDIERGERLALTGPTGAGKTTLADILLMLIRPDSGELRIDAEEVNDELAGRWREQAAYVPQDVVLFDSTIRDNLRLYVPDAEDSALEAALQQAAGDFVLDRLPEGLDTRVGHGGQWLSGGERQRIGIARALLRKPGFLVLDEPTAALDSATQQKLIEALQHLDRSMSVILITHRSELLQLVDRVVQVEDGVVSY